MTSPQLEPSAHAPCTSTTLRAAAGPAACADASAARSTSIAESILAANVIHFHSVFICRAPVRCVELPRFQSRDVSTAVRNGSQVRNGNRGRELVLPQSLEERGAAESEQPRGAGLVAHCCRHRPGDDPAFI